MSLSIPDRTLNLVRASNFYYARACTRDKPHKTGRDEGRRRNRRFRWYRARARASLRDAENARGTIPLNGNERRRNERKTSALPRRTMAIPSDHGGLYTPRGQGEGGREGKAAPAAILACGDETPAINRPIEGEGEGEGECKKLPCRKANDARACGRVTSDLYNLTRRARRRGAVCTRCRVPHLAFALTALTPFAA